MGNSRIHYVTGGALAECGLPWRNKRRTRAPERATCDGCREKLAQKAAAGVPSELRKRYDAAELAAIALVEALWEAREHAESRGRSAEAARLRQLRVRAADLRQELRELLGTSEAPGVQEGPVGACPACPHGRHEPGACRSFAGSLFSLALHRCNCAARVEGSFARGPRVAGREAAS